MNQWDAQLHKEKHLHFKVVLKLQTPSAAQGLSRNRRQNSRTGRATPAEDIRESLIQHTVDKHCSVVGAAERQLPMESLKKSLKEDKCKVRMASCTESCERKESECFKTVLLRLYYGRKSLGSYLNTDSDSAGLARAWDSVFLSTSQLLPIPQSREHSWCWLFMVILGRKTSSVCGPGTAQLFPLLSASWLLHIRQGDVKPKTSQYGGESCCLNFHPALRNVSVFILRSTRSLQFLLATNSRQD